MQLYKLILVLFLLKTLPAMAIEIDVDKLEPVTAIGMNNRIIAFSTKSRPIKGFEHVFNLNTMSIDDEQLNRLRFNKIKPTWKEYSLTFPIKHNNYSILDLRCLGTTKHVVDWSPLTGKRHRVFGFVKGGYWVSGGENGILYLYNTDGEKLSSFTGHSGTISALAYYNNWLVSGDSNGLIILWDLNEVKSRQKYIKPYLNLAYSKIGEWVIWSNEGVFNCSKNGFPLLNLASETSQEHLKDKEIFDRYARPDLLIKKIESPKLYQKQLSLEVFNKSGKIALPTVSFLNLPRFSQKRDVELIMKICDGGGGIDTATVYLRDAPIALYDVRRGIKKKGKSPANDDCHHFKKMVSLLDGENEITLVAKNDFGFESEPAKATVTFQSDQKQIPRLHVATIAVSDYLDSQLDLKYPIFDAEAIELAFNNLGYGIYKSVSNYTLYDNEVTKDNLKDLFDRLNDIVAIEDVFVMFIAGHGLYSTHDAQYHFLPYDVDVSSYDKAVDTSLGVTEFNKLLSKIKAVQTLLLIDTCQSGGFEGFSTKSETVTSAQVKAVHRLGRAALMASSKNQFAFEGYHGHGVFTYMVLDALKGKADYTKDGSISVDELSVYVSTKLPEATEIKWGYRQEAKRNMSGHNFELGKY